MVEKIKETLQKSFPGKIRDLELKNSNELYGEVDYENIREICTFIYSDIDCSLISLFANDESFNSSGYRLFYTFSIRMVGVLLVIHTRIPTLDEGVESIASEIPAAALYEREIRDMFGLKFNNMPDAREFVFHGNWPEELHPLQKSFDVHQKPEFKNRPQEFVNIEGTGVFEIPVGPVHAGIIEPGHFRFSVAGEPIIHLEAKLFYVHKGIEKLAENQHYQKVLFISERISGDETVSNSLAYSQAIERIAGLTDIPQRAQFTRTILAELERLVAHIGDISGICVDVAYGFAANQFAMMRRWQQMLNEEVTGSRYLRSSIKPGGLRRDFIKDKENILVTAMKKLEKEFNETVDIIKSNGLFIDRVENTGVVRNEIAVDLNAVGPAARACGVLTDVRKEFPYAAYGKLEFDLPVHHNGDVNCRMNTKIEEVNQAIRLILAALDAMPAEGAMLEPIGDLPHYGYAFGMTESPRGENCHWVMTGENNTIYRYKIRTPSFCNWPVLCHGVKGNIVPDFPLVNKSFNLSYAGNDL